MRSSRLLALLLLLQRRGHTTAGALARELEVSVRTIYRDIAALAAAGVPLWTEPGPEGGVRLVDGWRTTLDGLTADEATALFLSGAPQAVADLGLSAAAAHARTKVHATLGAQLLRRTVSVQRRFHLDAPGWFTAPETPESLPAVAEALWSDRRLDLRYGSAGARRRVDPLGLVLKAGVWYLVARSRGTLRTYRVARVRSARARAETFVRPDDFELAAWWKASAAAFDASLLTYPCRLRLSPWAVRRLPDAVPNDAVREMLAAAGPPDAEGWREVALRLESEEVAADQLVALGAGVEVLEPLPLRERLRAAGLELAARNG